MKITQPQVDLRSEESVLTYLSTHFRYNTMSSHNRATSFAHCVKINQLQLESDPRIQAFNAKHGRDAADSAAYRLLGFDDWTVDVSEEVIEDFTRAMDGCYTIGSNGRSSGYLVLYNSRRKESEHKSSCKTCGQRNFQAVPDLTANPLANRCGRCGAVGEHGRHNFEKPLTTLEIWPGRSIGEDLEDMSFGALKALAKVVIAFDHACLAIRERFIAMILDYEVTETVVMVPKAVKVLTPRAEAPAHA